MPAAGSETAPPPPPLPWPGGTAPTPSPLPFGSLVPARLSVLTAASSFPACTRRRNHAALHAAHAERPGPLQPPGVAPRRRPPCAPAPRQLRLRRPGHSRLPAQRGGRGVQAGQRQLAGAAGAAAAECGGVSRVQRRLSSMCCYDRAGLIHAAEARVMIQGAHVRAWAGRGQAAAGAPGQQRGKFKCPRGMTTAPPARSQIVCCLHNRHLQHPQSPRLHARQQGVDHSLRSARSSPCSEPVRGALATAAGRSGLERTRSNLQGPRGAGH